MEEGGGQAQADARGWVVRGSVASLACGRQEEKLELTDVILSSSHANKLAFCTKMSSLDGIKSGQFSSI